MTTHTAELTRVLELGRSKALVLDYEDVEFGEDGKAYIDDIDAYEWIKLMTEE